jgi:hypothetical protein
MKSFVRQFQASAIIFVLTGIRVFPWYTSDSPLELMNLSIVVCRGLADGNSSFGDREKRRNKPDVSKQLMSIMNAWTTYRLGSADLR